MGILDLRTFFKKAFSLWEERKYLFKVEIVNIFPDLGCDFKKDVSVLCARISLLDSS